MGFFDLFRGNDINKGYRDYNESEGAILVDVRSREEYEGGHLKGSHNVPLSSIADIYKVAKSQDTPLFVYCQSGARSLKAQQMLEYMGYKNVRNIGGIAGYSGERVR